MFHFQQDRNLFKNKFEVMHIAVTDSLQVYSIVCSQSIIFEAGVSAGTAKAVEMRKMTLNALNCWVCISLAYGIWRVEACKALSCLAIGMMATLKSNSTRTIVASSSHRALGSSSNISDLVPLLII